MATIRRRVNPKPGNCVLVFADVPVGSGFHTVVTPAELGLSEIYMLIPHTAPSSTLANTCPMMYHYASGEHRIYHLAYTNGGGGVTGFGTTDGANVGASNISLLAIGR